MFKIEDCAYSCNSVLSCFSLLWSHNIAMSSISGSRRLPQPQSGGKIVRPRRAATAKTPYDRPGPSNSAPRSPNWLSRFVLSPTRFVAAGAGKLVSSVLDLEPSPTSSSSSFASSSGSDDSGSGTEEVGTVNDESDVPFEGDDALKKGLQPLFGNRKNKHVIERLLIQETFSREECDRLISIIRSRVIDSPANEDDEDKRPRDILSRTLGNDTDSPDLCSAAVMEAKKWLQEKKSGLDSNSDLLYGSHSLNLDTMPQAFEDGGSPVDVAKSYMRARPPWASPSIDHIKPPSPIGIQLFKEETSYLIGGNSTSSSKLKRDSPATGSWSIQDEIRRVRSRATEQMLRTLPSSNIDWSALSIEYKNNVNSSAIENIEASLGEKVHNFINSVDASSNLARGLSTQASPDLERKRDGFQPEAVLSDSANINLEQNQGFEAVQQIKGSQDDCREITTSGQKHGLSDDMMTMMHRDCGLVKVNGTNDTNGANHQLNSVEETREASNSRLHDGNCSIFKDASANGFASSGTSFYAGLVIEQNTKTYDNEPTTVDSGQEKTAKGAFEQETCKLLSETSTDVPDVIVNDTVVINEDDRVATGSQNSSSVQHEAQQDYSQPGSESDLGATPSSIAKQKGKRITRYNRRGRSRGVK